MEKSKVIGVPFVPSEVRLRPNRSLPRSSPAIVVIVFVVGLGQRPLAKGGGQNGEKQSDRSSVRPIRETDERDHEHELLRHRHRP
jgi:hypothetical protein